MRYLITALAVFNVTSVLAAELPISGVYGDEFGCHRLTLDLDGVSQREGLNVFPRSIEGYEWICEFADVWPYAGDQTHAVQGVCSGEGVPFLEQFIFTLSPNDPTLMTVYSANGDERWRLSLCESNPGEGGKG